MTKFISCIMADYTLQDDGTMDCVWLGDLSVRRGCEYCMKYLEFKTMVHDEGWKSTDQAAHAKHPDWPGEWVNVWTYMDRDGKFIGYECQDELFKSLHEIEAAGWELIYSYCPLGKEIYRREEESLKTYYTKCGREFMKSTDASVTGYHMNKTDEVCAECPFQIEVKKGYPGEFDHWECRAGSQPPNQVDDWGGSVEDKNSLHIKSLHNDFLESVLEYCKAQPDLNADYNSDLADCRRQISVSCSSNKKGMAAKKALVEKFFGQTQEQNQEPAECCETCAYGIDFGESVEYIKCQEGIRNKDVKKKQTACANYIPVSNSNYGDDELDGDLEEQIDCLLKDGDMEDEKMASNKLCSCYGNGSGCQKKPEAAKWCLKADEASCKYFESQNEESNDNDSKITEIVNEIAEIDTKTSEIVTFDYSNLDIEIAEYLKTKATSIAVIRIKSVIFLGKELKEAQDKLANHDGGTFVKWFESIGLKKDTVYRNIRSYEWAFRNCENIDEIENIQPSLLFEVSKQSAPQQLQDQVLSGDITTHKQWKEKESEFKEKESEWKTKLDDARSQQDNLRTEKQQVSIKAMDAERRASKLENENDELKDQLEALQEQNNESNNEEELSEYKRRVAELENQLKDKPIETSAVQIMEKVPEKIAVEISLRLYGTLMAAKSISKEEIQIVHDTANDVRKNSIAEFLENLRDMIPGYLDILYDNVPTRKCEECEFCSWDGLKEVDEEKGLILCTQSAFGEPRLSNNDNPCQLFKER